MIASLPGANILPETLTLYRDRQARDVPALDFIRHAEPAEYADLLLTRAERAAVVAYILQAAWLGRIEQGRIIEALARTRRPDSALSNAQRPLRDPATDLVVDVTWHTRNLDHDFCTFADVLDRYHGFPDDAC